MDAYARETRSMNLKNEGKIKLNNNNMSNKWICWLKTKKYKTENSIYIYIIILKSLKKIYL